MGDSSDSDSENILFSKISCSSEPIQWDEEESSCKTLPFSTKVEICFIRKDIDEFHSLAAEGSKYYDTCKGTVCKVLQGKYTDAVLSSQVLIYDDIYDICMKGGDVPGAVRRYIVSRLRVLEPDCVEIGALECMVIGYAYYELYCQCNYTGPELSRQDTNRIVDEAMIDDLNAVALKCLESDGNYPFKGCQYPHTLLIARSVLAAVADLTRGTWQQGIVLDHHGNINPSKNLDDVDVISIKATKLLRMRHWLSARAAVVHLRLLQKQRYTDNPTLFKECQDMYADAEQELSNVCSAEWCHHAYAGSCVTLIPKTLLISQLHLEKGLCQHYFDFGDKGKKLFTTAKDEIHLDVTLTAALGKRTKWQQQDHAQLLVVAKSSISSRPVPAVVIPPAPVLTLDDNDDDTLPTGSVEQIQRAGATVPPQSHTELQSHIPVEETPSDPTHSEDESGWDSGKYEVGRRVVRADATTGEEVAVRRILLDDTDGGAQENILLEEGVKFTHLQKKDDAQCGSIEQLEEAQALASTILHPIDQSVILALCLDVSNSNPADGLTTEEMHPYIRSIVNQYHDHQKIVEDVQKAVKKVEYQMHTTGKTTTVVPQYDASVLEPFLNWMVYSTALLERSYLEFEKRRTMDRAMLQIQALLDQHTTRLTMFQPDESMIQSAAPAQERMLFLPCLIYPAQYEIKKDLAERYLRCQVFNSALNLFKELEMWDEVVTCFQLLQKPHRAELLVRERLAAGEETPYMTCALADLTNDESMYERSWLLSNGRYGRPKRTLARICFDSDRFEECVTHLDDALKVQPLVATAWYLRGIACMRLERWNLAIMSFTRCVQQDTEIGEAWANIGAVHMRTMQWERAHDVLMEAQKHKSRDWRITENLMMATLRMGKLRECILHMNALLDLRHNSGRPTHYDELRQLLSMAAVEVILWAREWKPSVSGKVDSGADDNGIEVPRIAAEIDKFLSRMINSVKNEPDMWNVVALYHEIIMTGGESGLHDAAKATLATAAGQGLALTAAESMMRKKSALSYRDCRTRQLRSLVQVNHWEKILTKVEEVVRVVAILSDIINVEMSSGSGGLVSSELYELKSLVSSASLKVSKYLEVEQPEGNGTALTECCSRLLDYVGKLESFYNLVGG